jgi:RES domain-containing protein
VLTTWRITKAQFADQIFGGEGARAYGGRWNSQGYWVAYTSATASLAILELLANADQFELIGEFALASCSFDESLVSHVEIDDLPPNWREPRPPVELRDFGDEWICSERSAVLSVPSVIIGQERNYLLNPAHDDFRTIKLSSPEPFRLDLRLT